MAAVNSGTVTPSEMAAALIRAGFAPAVVPVMVAIGLAESGGRIDAINHNTNGSTDYGVWQINSVHGFNPQTLMTLDGNARAAKQVYDGQGLHAWATFNSGVYRQHLPAGQSADPTSVSASVGAAPEGFGITDVFAPFTALFKPIEWLAKAGAVLTSADFWKRVGIALLGAGFGIAAIVIFVHDQRG